MGTSAIVSTRNDGLDADQHAPLREKIVGIGRAAGGALIFSLPMLMTMELWWLGFTLDRFRLAMLVIVTLPLLVGLARRIGFEDTWDWQEDVRDACVAFTIGLLTAAVVLAVFKVIGPGMSFDEVIGKIVLQAIPASIGALLGRSQLGGEDGDDDAAEQNDDTASSDTPLRDYGGELFLMAVGALFLSLNVAPTDEMPMIAHMMTPLHAVLLLGVSLLVMHGFVYAVGFKGSALTTNDAPWISDFVRFTLVGYLLAILISLFVLWSFGRLDGEALLPTVMTTIVLAFPAALGAAAARLIL
ncbi:TIGR02587 family membrane protein [Rhizobium sp. EC-SD404]|uniref:TIGR02587 family membrane protein n=1 Tax=Rhizobium sp. EC-SD404 TaxID=2038389 RepID=UPI00125EC3D8|nr:TIGR02587 family membrane protein [Rhizobium sp. EC-SD404]